MVFGSAAVGAIIASTLTSYFDDHLLEIPITTIVARGSYLLTGTTRTIRTYLA